MAIAARHPQAEREFSHVDLIFIKEVKVWRKSYESHSQHQMTTLSFHNEQHNIYKLERFQDIMSLTLGVASGILCLESHLGFAFYLVGITLTNTSFHFMCCEGSKQFYRTPGRQIYLRGLLANLPGYVMMWCLTYALIQ